MSNFKINDRVLILPCPLNSNRLAWHTATVTSELQRKFVYADITPGAYSRWAFVHDLDVDDAGMLNSFGPSSEPQYLMKLPPVAGKLVVRETAHGIEGTKTYMSDELELLR